MSPESVADLKLFIEKSELLMASSFSDSMLRNQSAVLFEWVAGKPYESVLIGAEGESVDAALLTLRMLIQNNDRISLANMAKIFSKEPELSSLKDAFEEIRGQVNSFLEMRNGVDFFGKNYTYKEAFDLLLYGSKAHANREKEVELMRLLKSDFVSQLFMFQANTVAATLIRAASALADICRKGLQCNGV